jgi:hypothetical protein
MSPKIVCLLLVVCSASADDTIPKTIPKSCVAYTTAFNAHLACLVGKNINAAAMKQCYPESAH